ncbi:sigma-54-dependent transcriptional regulator [Syntrophomonas palmitatica]|uniref:sigma-54-dependent transcriptional regulator n=1 Tax=Syntrophomonas palmitatica TaxID=402877 RepID=UPI001FA6BD69|nr:sigma-54 dependent transcriptional regulator [Syntrophomonas palmitatica]
MLVDDEERSRIHLADFLRKLGHQVLDKHSTSEALETLARQNVDLLLTDLRMPGNSGVDLMHQVRHMPNRQALPMVLFTAYGDMESSIEAMRAGAMDYLLKPLNIEELIKVIDKAAELKTNPANKQPDALNEPLPMEATPAPLTMGPDEEIAVCSKSMREIMNVAIKLHQNPSIPVLIEGETGTGKELIARFVHFGNEGSSSPFIAINCAAISASLFESELFGYESGSFSGGLTKGKEGKLDLAQGGSLFLDEISEIPLDLQAKLLRLIQEREFYRVGGLQLIKSNTRIIGASNRNLKEAVLRGEFRQDLYYRLKVGHIYLPPLRLRKDGLLNLVKYLMQTYSKNHNKHFKEISPQAARILMQYDWPGNIRELRNIIEWIVLTEDDNMLRAEHLSAICSPIKSNPASPMDEGAIAIDGIPLDQISNSVILRALKINNGNKAATARNLGISRSALYYRLRNMDYND